MCVCVAENNDLSRELEDAQSKLTQLSRLKTSLTSQIDELKRQVDEENKVSATLILRLNLSFNRFFKTFLLNDDYQTGNKDEASFALSLPAGS